MDQPNAILSLDGVEWRPEYDQLIANLGDSAPLGARAKVHRQILFLDAFRKGGLIGKSCQLVGFSRKTFESWVSPSSNQHDAVFNEAWRSVEAQMTDRVEKTAYGLATGKYKKMVVSAGQLIGEEKIFSERMIEMILRARMPGTYTNVERREITGAEGGPIMLEAVRRRVDAELDALSDRVRLDYRAVTSGEDGAAPEGGEASDNGQSHAEGA